MHKEQTKKVILKNSAHFSQIFGINDENLKLIESKFGVRINTGKEGVNLTGEKKVIQKTEEFFLKIEGLLQQGLALKKEDLKYIIRLSLEEKDIDLKDIISSRIPISAEKGFIAPKSPAQRDYVQAIRNHDIIFCIGPAGTGKTYLAIASAVAGLINKKFNRIILVRPAVEAGEKLGFLPGDLYEKINPYLRPLYDALYDMVNFEKVETWIEEGLIEIIPLAYMRGRTLNDSFIIMDEAQNATCEQMKMFLTRLGFNSKAIITGDITQTDLPQGKRSGLVDAQHILKNIEPIKFIYLTERDVVRHELVSQIIRAYHTHENKKNK